MPGGCASAPRADGQSTGGASSMATATAAMIIDSFMVTHSIVITVIVTICVLTVTLALQ